MKFRFIALNLMLLAGLGAVAWQARLRWDDAQARRRNHIAVRIQPQPAPALVAAPKPEAASAAKYAEVATKDLFAKDRNPAVVIEIPKVEPPKPMPALPVVYGVLGLPSGTKAIMSDKPGNPGMAVRAGDTIGVFRIASLDPQNVVFDWDGKQVAKKIEDLIDRSAAPTPGGQAAPVQASAPGRAAAPVVNSNQPVPAAPGPGGSCVPGDNSPAGTVSGGMKKNVFQSPFGQICNWVAGQ